MIKIKRKLFLFWQSCLDKIGITDPWTQFAITGLLKIVIVFALLVTVVVWSVRHIV